MTKTTDRKAAIAAFKKRKVEAGIYAVKCLASGEVWVGRSPNIDSVQTRIWFTLRTGGSSFPEMQKAWDDHGAGSFSFEVLERLEEKPSAYLRDAELKERATHWRAALGADAI